MAKSWTKIWMEINLRSRFSPFPSATRGAARAEKRGRKDELQAWFRHKDKTIPASRRPTIINAIIAFNCREWQDYPSPTAILFFPVSLLPPPLRSGGGWKRKMAANPVGGGYLNSAPLQASHLRSLWDQATRTKLFSFRLIRATTFSGKRIRKWRIFARRMKIICLLIQSIFKIRMIF